MENIGRVIRRRLAELRMSPAELAARLGVSKATVSYWINGEKRPNFGRLNDIAKALDCSVDVLLGMKMPGLEEVDQRLQSVISRLIAAHDRVLRKDDRGVLLSSIEGILDLVESGEDTRRDRRRA